MIPHRWPILAVRRLVEATPTHARVLMRVDPDSTLLVDGVCPAVAALELVGQACAAHADATGQGAGRAGFIVRARGWTFADLVLPVGVDLEVQLTRVDDGVGDTMTVEGAVHHGHLELARGRVLVQRAGVSD